MVSADAIECRVVEGDDGGVHGTNATFVVAKLGLAL